MGSTLRTRLQADLRAAMKARDALRIGVLRSALSALANAEAVDVTDPSAVPVAFGTSEVRRQELDEAGERAVLATELQEVRGAAAELRRLDRTVDADDLDARATVLASYVEPR